MRTVIPVALATVVASFITACGHDTPTEVDDRTAQFAKGGGGSEEGYVIEVLVAGGGQDADINRSGTIVGRAGDGGFAWRAGVVEPIAPPNGASSARLQGMNDDELIAGYAIYPVSEGVARQSATLWTPGAQGFTALDLGAQLNAGSEANGVDAASAVTGKHGNNIDNPWRAFVWLPTGEVRDLEPLPGAVNGSIGNSIDDLGYVAGVSSGHDGNNSDHAVIWLPGGTTPVDLGPGNTRDIVTDAAGARVYVVGWTFQTVRNKTVQTATRWTVNAGDGGIVETRLLGPGVALGVNPSGDVVGTADSKAVLWTAGGETVRLSCLAKAASCGATAINGDGVIVGWSGGSHVTGGGTVRWVPVGGSN